MEDKNDNKEDNKEDKNETQKKENNNIENKIEKEEDINEQKNVNNNEDNKGENQDEKKGERKEGKDNIKEDNKVENKEENKDAIDNQNEEEKNKEEDKNENNKDINNIMNKNINDNIRIEEKKEEEEKEENENSNVRNILGDIFRNVVKIKSKKPKENLRMSLYRNNLNNEQKDFSSIIKDIINEIKQNTFNFFDKTMKELDKKYNEYIKEINKFINENELKMSKLLKNKEEIIENVNLLDFADNYIFEKFENIFEIHQNIFDSIEEHIGLLKIFLEQSTLIQQENPLESYINNNCNEILSSSFLNKIDCQKLDLSKITKNQDLSDLCSKYMGKKKDNNFSSITIKKKGKEISSFELNFVRENMNNLKKMKLIKMGSGDISSLFKVTNANKRQIKAPCAEKLSSLTLINSELSLNDFNKISSPSLTKLKLIDNNLSLNIKSFVGKIVSKALTLEKLYLQRCFIDNQSLSAAFEFLSDSPQILESLKILSFADNDITKVNMTNNIIRKQCIFKNLQYIDCSKNNIYDFSQENFQAFPELKVLELTDNNISNHVFFDNVRKIPDNIVLLSNNLFLNNNSDNAGKYRKYLNNKLMLFNHKIKTLDLSFLYNKSEQNQLVDLKFSPMIKLSLIKLNLSYCGLEDNSVTQFLQNNFGLLNLKELNLSNNLFTMDIFNLLFKNEIILDNLYLLDLSMNSINTVNSDKYKQLELFVLSNSKLKKVKLLKTKFLQELLLLMVNKQIEIDQINQRLSNKDIKFIVEKDYELLIKPFEDLSLFEIEDKEIDAY